MDFFKFRMVIPGADGSTACTFSHTGIGRVIRGRGQFSWRSLNGREIAAVMVLSDGYTFDSCRRGLCGVAKHRGM